MPQAVFFQLELVASFVGNSEFFTTMCAACSQYAATVSGSHSLAETMFVATLALRGLECAFHLFVVFMPITALSNASRRLSYTI